MLPRGREHRLGLRSFGVPIYARDGSVRVGLSMSYRLLDRPDEAVMLNELRATAAALGRSLAD